MLQIQVQFWLPLPHLTNSAQHVTNNLNLILTILFMGFSRQNTEVVCHSLLQWPTFCQTSPPWPGRLGWSHTAWLSFTELDNTVVHVIRLAICLWLWFQSVCPLMPSLSAYRLTWVSLTLDLGYLFTAAPAKHSHCSLPWTCGSSSMLCLGCSKFWFYPLCYYY